MSGRVEVNGCGTGPTQRGVRRQFHDQLTPSQRKLFDAQMKAWKAGCALILEFDTARENSKYQDPHSARMRLDSIQEASQAWTDARLQWGSLRRQYAAKFDTVHRPKSQGDSR
jgi:uncharacterized phage-associated protein